MFKDEKRELERKKHEIRLVETKVPWKSMFYIISIFCLLGGFLMWEGVLMGDVSYKVPLCVWVVSIISFALAILLFDGEGRYKAYVDEKVFTCWWIVLLCVLAIYCIICEVSPIQIIQKAIENF